MPIYQKLQPHPGDAAERWAEKQRIASRLFQLHAALRDHLYGRDESGESTHEWDSKTYLRLAIWNIREFDFEEGKDIGSETSAATISNKSPVPLEP